MERRKFVIGLGALASGSAAAMGTGAFTTASMERSATVRVSNDDTDAKMGYSTKVGYDGGDPSNGRSIYADVNGGVLEIDFSDGNSGSSGMNPNGAVYTFERVFKIVNQGNSTILVGLDVGPLEDLDAIESAEASALNGADLSDTLDFSTDPVSINNWKSGAELAPGEDLIVGFRFETANKSGYSTPFEQTPDVSIGGVDVNA